MQRTIVHLDLDSFFVSCERLRSNKLTGIPLIIGGGDRGVVSSCSYEARYFGVRSAMPMNLAMRLCPHAKVIKGDMELYTQISNVVTEIIRDNAPVMEKASIDEFYLDLTGMDKFFSSQKWVVELSQKIIKETHLPLSYGLSINKTVSKIGTNEAKPSGSKIIPRHEVQSFLNPLSIRKIPMLGQVTYDTLTRIGIRTIATLSEMPSEIMFQLLGKNGLDIWKKANGIDFSPVEPYRERKSISTEHTYQQDTMDMIILKNSLLIMIEKLCFQLREEEWLTSVVTVKIRYNNFDTETKQCKIAYTSANHILKKYVFELFEKLYHRRMRLRLIGIQFSGLVRGNYQIDLFEDSHEIMALYEAIDKIKRQYGTHIISHSATAISNNKKK